MLEWLIPLAVGSLALIPKKASERKKLEQIFINSGMGIQKKDNIEYPKFIKEVSNETYTTYLYKIPLGIPSEDFEEIIPALKDGLNKEVECEFDGVLKVHVYHQSLPKKWEYTQDLIQPGTWETPVGKNHQGILYHDFDKYPHMLIGGITRFGKTVLLKGIFHTLYLNNPEDAEFYILDLKGGLEFYKFSSLPNVKVACDVYQAAAILADISEEIIKAEEHFREKGYTNIVDTPIKKRNFIIVDEGAELAPDFVLGSKKKYAEICQTVLSEITRIGGGLGFRCIYCTQYPTKKSVDMSIKSNIVARVSFIAATGVASQVILDETGAEDLPAIPGRAYYRVDKKRVIQVPYISDKEMKQRLKQWEVKNHDPHHAPKNEEQTGEDTFYIR